MLFGPGIKDGQRSRIPEKDTCVYSTSYTAINFDS